MTDKEKQHRLVDDASSYALAATIRKELAGYLVKAILGTAAVCIVGSGSVFWYYLEHHIPQIAHGVPGGAIMAFERDCPEGWEPFEEATSRVIVGYGTFTHLRDKYLHDQHGALLSEHTLLELGGEQLVMEAVPQRPEQVQTASSGSSGDSTSTQGGSNEPRLLAAPGLPHNHYTNMPPYIALAYCRSKF